MSAMTRWTSRKLPGPVNVRYDFDEGGKYELAVAFLEGEEILAQASFDLEVKSMKSASNTSKSVALVLFAIFLFTVISVVWHRRHAPSPMPVVTPKPKAKKTRKKKASAKR